MIEAIVFRKTRCRRPRLLALMLALFAAFSLAGQHVFVSSRNTNSVKRYDLATGTFLGDFVSSGNGGLSLPQEVVWHPDGFLLVTGRGNTAVKKYDGATGAYLGNFTSGYTLDNPTKTTIGNDSLLYVSQWGTSKNKVVRFDLKTGVFVDEFTNVGVPNGCGHAWDDAGNLLVAQYGDGVNGRVLKFDTNGVMTGVFIPSTLLQGPVNLWYDDAGDLFVADWTVGKVLRFDGTTGAFQTELVAGLANVEGYAFDSQGRLYLCDWTANKVFRYNFETASITPFIQSGNLMAPNSILIREPAVSPVQEKNIAALLLEVSPNPSDSAVRVRYALEKKAAVRLEVLNASGQPVAVLFEGLQAPGNHEVLWNGPAAGGLAREPGIFFIRLTAGDRTAVQKLLWQ